MRLRCFLVKYSDGSELLRWFLPDRGDGWAQQVGVMRLYKEGGYEDTSSNPWEIMFLAGFDELLKEGLVEELT